jgi:hypothetical protein
MIHNHNNYIVSLCRTVTSIVCKSFTYSRQCIKTRSNESRLNYKIYYKIVKTASICTGPKFTRYYSSILYGDELNAYINNIIKEIIE